MTGPGEPTWRRRWDVLNPVGKALSAVAVGFMALTVAALLAGCGVIVFNVAKLFWIGVLILRP